MAKRAFSNMLRDHITSCPVELFVPQDTLKGESGRTLQVIGRGTSGWRGVLTLGVMGRLSVDLKNEMLAFIDSLEGTKNTFDLPVQGLAGEIAGNPDLTLASAPSIAGGFTMISVTGAMDGLERGNAVSINSRLYRLQSDLITGGFTALPALAEGSAGDTVEWQNPVVEARLTERGAQVAQTTPSFMGPFALEWESV